VRASVHVCSSKAPWSACLGRSATQPRSNRSLLASSVLSIAKGRPKRRQMRSPKAGLPRGIGESRAPILIARNWSKSLGYRRILHLQVNKMIIDLILVETGRPDLTVAGFARQIPTALGARAGVGG
jgi:hypothetical protein